MPSTAPFSARWYFKGRGEVSVRVSFDLSFAKHVTLPSSVPSFTKPLIQYHRNEEKWIVRPTGAVCARIPRATARGRVGFVIHHPLALATPGCGTRVDWPRTAEYELEVHAISLTLRFVTVLILFVALSSWTCWTRVTFPPLEQIYLSLIHICSND